MNSLHNKFLNTANEVSEETTVVATGIRLTHDGGADYMNNSIAAAPEQRMNAENNVENTADSAVENTQTIGAPGSTVV